MRRILSSLPLAAIAACGASPGEQEESSWQDVGEESSESEGSFPDLMPDVGGGEWPDCAPAEGIAVWGFLQAPDWPFVPPPMIESATCAIESLEEQVGGSGYTTLWLHLDCEHPEAGPLAVELGGGEKDALGGRLDGLVGLEAVTLSFQLGHQWTEIRSENATLRDSEGNLLLAVTTTEPPPGQDGWDGVAVGVPDGAVSQSAWLAPFDSVVIRDDVCPDLGPDESGEIVPDWPGATARRLGLEARTGDQSSLAVGGTEVRGIVTPGGTFDFLVGNTYRLLEAPCSDCQPVSASFMLIRTGE